MLPSKASQAPARTFLALLLASAVLPFAAHGEEAAPAMPEDPRAPRYHEVERGFFSGFEVGYLSLFKTPVADPAKFPFAPKAGGGNASGLLVGTTLGYDLSSRLAVALYAVGGNARASISYGVPVIVSSPDSENAKIFMELATRAALEIARGVLSKPKRSRSSTATGSCGTSWATASARPSTRSPRFPTTGRRGGAAC